MIRFLSLLVITTLLVGCEKRRTPARCLVPFAYEGVLVTIFDQVGFPALPTKDGFQIYQFPDDGIIITSSKQEFGWASDETLDVMQDGSYLRIPSRLSGGRCERFAATGSRTGFGEPEIKFFFMAVGSDEYWKAKGAREYDAKVDEAVQKIIRIRNQRSEPGGAASGSQPIRPDTNSTSSAAGSRR